MYILIFLSCERSAFLLSTFYLILISPFVIKLKKFIILLIIVVVSFSGLIFLNKNIINHFYIFISMVRKHKQKPVKFQKIATERINSLFKQAKEIFYLDPKLSNRYVQLARKIAMRYKVKIESKYKRQYCKHCYIYFIPPKTCRVRTKNGKLIYSCFNCKKFSRFGYK